MNKIKDDQEELKVNLLLSYPNSTYKHKIFNLYVFGQKYKTDIDYDLIYKLGVSSDISNIKTFPLYQKTINHISHLFNKENKNWNFAILGEYGLLIYVSGTKNYPKYNKCWKSFENKLKLKDKIYFINEDFEIL